MPGAEPIRHDGGDVAVLLCHGFTSTPGSMAEWAAALADDGRTVSVPRLPGHGTTWQEMNRTRWQDWYAAVENELLDLSATHGPVFVGGLSMGGALALRLAVHHPDAVAGLMLVNPCIHLTDRTLPLRTLQLAGLPLLRHLVPALPGIASDIRKQGVAEVAYAHNPLHALHSATRLFADVKRDLPQVTAPHPQTLDSRRPILAQHLTPRPDLDRLDRPQGALAGRVEKPQAVHFFPKEVDAQRG